MLSQGGSSIFIYKMDGEQLCYVEYRACNFVHFVPLKTKRDDYRNFLPMFKDFLGKGEVEGVSGVGPR